MGILYHLGTAELLDRLLRMREKWVGRITKVRPGPVRAMTLNWHGDTLIAAMCGRMALSPRSVDPLDRRRNPCCLTTSATHESPAAASSKSAEWCPTQHKKEDV